MTVGLLIFDFDGVIADSEGLANEVLARYATELGTPMSQQNALDRFAGKRIRDVTASVEQLVGRPLPGFTDELQRRTLKAFETGLREVCGVGAFLHEHRNLPRCIASSSAPERIKFCVSLLKLGSYFGDNIFSADQVARGKPHPDIFQLAADRMNADRTTAVVIEDSPGGVQAALAAGMRVIGLLAATHLRHDHREKLRAAGAELLAADYNEVSKILATL
jgi:HAD superfamily hydrolase (TIGR01509 family)